MNRIPNKRVLATRTASEFVGRSSEVETLLAHSGGKGRLNGLALLAAPSAGLSELLRQVYDRLFAAQRSTIPFYFEFRKSDLTAAGAARRFLREFLVQTVAFRRNDPSILDASPDLTEIAQLATPADGYWIDRLIEALEHSEKFGNDRSLVRICFSAPLRAAARGGRTFVMIDGLHVVDGLASGETLFENLIDIFSRSATPFVLGGLRRSLFARTPFETMYLEPLSFADAGRLIESVSARTSIPTNGQTRDLIGVQLGCNPRHIASLFAAAVENETALDTFSRIETIYTDEIFGGRIARHCDELLNTAFPDAATQARILRLLSETIITETAMTPVAYWQRQAGLEGAALGSAINELHIHELVNFTSGSIGIDPSDLVFCDYVRGRVRLEFEREPRALVVGESLSENIRRAPQLMARHYRQSSSLDLHGLMLAFDGQQISEALIDYGRFKDEFKGADEDRILKSVKEDNEKFTLPRIVYTAHTAAFYPRLDESCVRERSAVGIGFSDPAEKNEIVWIAAEIESKLEASRETAELWCDRLELAALHSNFQNYRLWLIAPEGFSAGALAVLIERNGYGTSRKQARLLGTLLNANVAPGVSREGAEYEITVPMGEDTEMIAAHTVEDIARRHGFPAKAINQIKTALVEACINAAEHSLSPDRRIHQRFVVTGNAIEITVTNRGLRLADKDLQQQIDAPEGRRGWGLKLMRSLMDDVRIVRSDDGTRITMTKSIKPSS